MEKQLRKRLTDLACLLRQLDPCPDPDSEESVPHQELSRDESRQQDLLDAFAFIAATEKSAEHVMAVGMEKIGNTLRFSMAMNGQIPSQIISGLEGLSEAIRNGDSAAPDAILVEELFLQVLNLKAGVIKAQLNGKKPPGVLHRLDEACKHLASLGDAKIPAYTGELKLTGEEKPNAYNAETHTSYMTTGIKRLENLRDSCQQALEELRFPGNVKADGALLPFLISCYELRHNQVLHHLLVESGKIPQGAKLHAQLRKFSRYKKSVKDLVSASSFLRQFQKVEYERVPTTAPLQLPPPTNNAIPELLQSLGLQDVELQNKCKKGFQMLRSKPLHVHAEVELIFFYATRGRKPEKFIGCSKLACFLCNMFLGFHPKFQVRGAHRKVYSGWTLPKIENAPRSMQPVLHNMCQELERMIKWRCLQKRELGTGGRPLPPDSVSGISESVLANTVSQAKGLSHERLLERIYQMWPSNQDTAETHETSEGPMEMLSPEGSKSTSMKKQMCQLCIKEPGRMQCPSCHNAWYCSKRCLEAAQYSHVFKCAGRAITTADYLVLACHDDLFPNDEETNRDFGFGNCVTPQEKSNLMGLYIGLVTRVGITGAELYAWQKTGSLAEKICETYEEAFKRQPHAYRGEYYPWFLKNKHIVTQVGTKSGDRLTDTMDAQSQFYLQSDRNIPYNHLPETKRDVAAFYGIIQMGWHPGPGDGNGLWMAFGFCTLKHESEENEFAKFYRELFKRAPFVSFHEAYLDGSLEKLARRVGLEDIVDAWVKRGAAIGLKPGTPRSSVYDLKEFVLSKFDQVDPEASVIVDYGYANCRDPRERELWKTVYSKLFMTGACDLNELHEACIKGRLYEYVKEVRPDTPRSFERLAKNLYPLPEY